MSNTASRTEREQFDAAGWPRVTRALAGVDREDNQLEPGVDVADCCSCRQCERLRNSHNSLQIFA